MLIGAFSGVVGSYLTGNVWLGALFAMAMNQSLMNNLILYDYRNPEYRKGCFLDWGKERRHEPGTGGSVYGGRFLRREI